ncbi:MAG: ABC transporter ATP-binding protein [Thermoplasmata archaeon]
MIEIEHLFKKYGSKTALNDVSMTAMPGEIIGIVGPNGSGKSTLIKILACLLRPTSGKVTIHGYDLTRQKLKIKEIIGYVPERTAIWDDLNAFENLYYWGRIKGVEKKILIGKIEILLERIKLSHELRLVATFSKGMKQRVAIGMAFIDSPKVILLDEATSGLDPGGRLILRQMIKNHAREKGTVILSTHDLLEAEKICTKIVFIKNGSVCGIVRPGEEGVEERYMELME